MSPKQPGKQKRAAQNRSRRAEREARAANAARSGTEPVASGSSPAGAGASAGGAKGLLGRLRTGGTGTSPSRTAKSRGGGGAAGRPRLSMAEARALQPPGLRAALSGVFAALAAIAICLFILPSPVDADGDPYTGPTLVADWTATAVDAVVAQPAASADDVVAAIDDWAPGREETSVAAALWPWSLTMALPLGGALLAFWAVRARKPSKIVNRALYATLLGSVLTQGLLLLFLPVVLAVGVAMFQVRKAETAAAADGVIDVEPVDDEDLEGGDETAETAEADLGDGDEDDDDIEVDAGR